MLETSSEDHGPKLPRDRYIPVRKRDIVAAILADPRLAPDDAPQMAELARRLALLFHIEYFAEREALKDLYVRFNPDQPGEGPIPPAAEEQAEFLEALDRALVAANYTRLSEADLAAAEQSRARVRATIRVPKNVFADIRFYGRGWRRRPVTIKTWFGLKRETIETVVYDHVVFVAALKHSLPAREIKGTRLRAGALYIKLFRDIPQADLNTLYPNARVVMGLRDKLILGVPAVVGGIPILLNILPALSVLFLVIGAYLGITGTVEGDAVKKALAALSGLAALGGFLMRQWIKYERQALKYQKQVADNVYFNNVNNNLGFFDYLIGASEDSEVKEALLAYFFLHVAEAPLTRPDLDRPIEAWLTERFGVDIDFEIDDALAKLERLGLMTAEGGQLSAVPLESALARCQEAWLRHAEAAEAAV